MNAFMNLILLFATLIALLTQGAAAPIPTAAAVSELDSGVPVQRATSPFLPPEPEHVVKHFVTPTYPAATATATPTLAPVDEETTDDGRNRSWAETHPAELIASFTLIPFAACIALYPLFRWLARRRAAARLAKRPISVENPKQPESPTSPYINNPRLVPLPAHPQMVYVPPPAKDGTRSLFGHFRSPSGDHVYGVTDRWIMSEGGAVYGVIPKGYCDLEKLFVHPV